MSDAGHRKLQDTAGPCAVTRANPPGTRLWMAPNDRALKYRQPHLTEEKERDSSQRL